MGILPGQPDHRAAAGATPVTARPGVPHGLWRWLRIVIVGLAVLAAVAVLYGIVQVFICELRELVFPGMPRRAAWLCP